LVDVDSEKQYQDLVSAKPLSSRNSKSVDSTPDGPLLNIVGFESKDLSAVKDKDRDKINIRSKRKSPAPLTLAQV